MKSERVPVAREGYPFILATGFLTLILALLGLAVWALAGLVVTGFVLWFFRDPSRVPPMVDQGVVSPADGKVILITDVEDDRFLHRKATRISIFMNIFSVHVNRSPCEAIVESVLFRPGRFYAADQDKALLHNEYCAMTLSTASGQRLAVVQVAGLIARRIVCRAEPGDQLRTGERYGLIRFGSRVDLYLPPESALQVQINQQVRAGETLLARLPSVS